MLAWTALPLLGFLYSRSSFYSTQRPREAYSALKVVETCTERTDGVRSALSLPDQPTFAFRLQPHPSVRWIIRPATVADRIGCAALLNRSYHTLLRVDYSDECLSQCLPLITPPREQLLTCKTWYVAEHPSTRQIVGCGGWTLRRPQPNNTTNTANATYNTIAVEPSLTNATSSHAIPDSEPPKRPPLVPQLRHFAVHPDYVRMGIASSIWQRTQLDIQTQFAAEDLPLPELYVFSTCTGVSFYASLGFVAVQTVDFQLTKDGVFPTVLMRRNATT